MDAEGIGREQPVIAHMPPGRVARVGRMVEDRDPISSHAFRTGHWPRIITPLGTLAPSVTIGLSPRIENGSTLGLVRSLQAHRLSQTNGEGALLGIAQDQRSAHRTHGDLEIQLTYLSRRRMKDHPALVFRHHDPGLGHPAISRAHHRLLVLSVARDPVFGERLMHGRSGSCHLAPKIRSIGHAVGPPQRVVMRMILLFAPDFLLRPTPGHVNAIRTQERIQERPGHVPEMVLGHQR